MVDEGNRPTGGEPPPDQREARLRSALDPDVFEAIGGSSGPPDAAPPLASSQPPPGAVACERCGTMVKPDDLFWDKGDHICLSCMEARRHTRQVKPEVIMWVGAAALFLLVLLGGIGFAAFRSYRTTPAYALDEIRSAIGNHDRTQLDRHVDVRALSLQIDAACRRLDANPLERSVYMASTVADGLRCAQIVQQDRTSATAQATTEIPGTETPVSITFNMRAYPDASGVRWVVTDISNVDQIAAEFYR